MSWPGLASLLWHRKAKWRGTSGFSELGSGATFQFICRELINLAKPGVTSDQNPHLRGTEMLLLVEDEDR